MFGYGFLSVVLVLYLAALGLDDAEIGALLALTLMGDAVVSLALTTRADRVGRRRVLVAGAALMVVAGTVFIATRSFAVLVLAATIGVISPSGNEVGPFLAVEQASLAQTASDRRRTSVFAWFALTGSLATAAGALAGGAVAQLGLSAGLAPTGAYRLVVAGYVLVGLVLAILFVRLSPAIEVPLGKGLPAPRLLGLHRSQGVVPRLAALFSLDAFAGGFVMQSLVAYWFHVRFAIGPATIGAIFFGANLLAAASALAATRIAARIGLLNTMVLTHLPSNVLLVLVPLMPSLQLAIAVLLARFAISQMDVPTRQSYTLAVVDPDERSAAAGVTGIARSVGAGVAPLASAPLVGNPALAGLPFVIAGGLKIVYDLLIWTAFRRVHPPEEGGPGAGGRGDATARAPGGSGTVVDTDPRLRSDDHARPPNG